MWKECCFKFLKPDSTGNLLFEFGKFYSAWHTICFLVERIDILLVTFKCIPLSPFSHRTIVKITDSLPISWSLCFNLISCFSIHSSSEYINSSGFKVITEVNRRNEIRGVKKSSKFHNRIMGYYKPLFFFKILPQYVCILYCNHHDMLFFSNSPPQLFMET